jgi:hypothetical protein
MDSNLFSIPRVVINSFLSSLRNMLADEGMPGMSQALLRLRRYIRSCGTAKPFFLFS